MNTKPAEAGRDFRKDSPALKTAPYLGVSTLVSNAIKNVMRADLETRAGVEGGASIVMLNSLKDFLQKELTMGIAAICMQSVAVNAKHMSREEFLAYARTLQALTLGYKSRYGKNLATVIMIGITTKARDSRSAREYLNAMLSGLSLKAASYGTRIEERSRKSSDLSYALKRKQSSIIGRIFGKGEIVLLTQGVSNHQEKLAALQGRKVKYEALATRIKGIADPQSTKSR